MVFLPRVALGAHPSHGCVILLHYRNRMGGGLCGHCSRDLPLDRRLLFVAELTGQIGWWVVSVMLRRWSGWTSALQAARDLYATNNPKWWTATALHRALPLAMRMNS